ncbi:hypothetical protein [Nocardioides sp.]|uniref:hypothetical protein n=1 Tax=Nocardioides sp. TaxID=35761 RepID=UPI0035143297
MSAAGGTGGAGGLSLRRLRIARAVVLGIVVVDLAALGVTAVQRVETTTTTSAPLVNAQAAPAPVLPAAPSSVPVVPDAVVPPGLVTDVPIDPGPPAPVGPAPEPTDEPTPDPEPTDEPTPVDPVDPGGPGEVPASDAAVFKECPAPLPAPGPEDDGGLRSLVPLAPAFGPFSGEAFAPAAAYQPFLQVLGPLLARYPSLHRQLAPALDPLVEALGSGATSFLDALTPLYGPYRQRVLQAEADLAAALAPLSERAAYSEIGGCLVALQAALLPDDVRS